MLCTKCNHATTYPDGRTRCHDGTILNRADCLAFSPGRAKMYNPKDAKHEEVKKVKPIKPVAVETHRPLVGKVDSESEALFDALGSAQSKKSKKTKKSKVSKDQMSFKL